jgi:RNA processing factor Prp31
MREAKLQNGNLQCDISYHLNDLNVKLRHQQKLISDMFGAVTDFDTKLKLFLKQVENVEQWRFPSCDLLYKD